jgi:hypothetical protein
VSSRSLKESLHTKTAGGRLIFHVFGALVDFERMIIRERAGWFLLDESKTVY